MGVTARRLDGPEQLIMPLVLVFVGLAGEEDTKEDPKDDADNEEQDGKPRPEASLVEVDETKAIRILADRLWVVVGGFGFSHWVLARNVVVTSKIPD